MHHQIKYTNSLVNPIIWTPCSGILNAVGDATTATSGTVPFTSMVFFRVSTVSPNPFGY